MTNRFLLLFTFLLSPSLLMASTVRAKFVDQNKKSLGNVESKMIPTPSGEEIFRKSNKKGEVQFEKVPAGTYHLIAQLKEHISVKSEPLQVADKDLDITLVLPEVDAFQKVEAAGNAAFEQQKYDEALKHYQEALSMSPQAAVIWSNMAKAYAAMNDLNKATEAAQKAATLDPDQFATLEKQVRAWVKFEEGKKYLEQKEFPKAVTALTEAVEGDSSLAEAYYGLALAYGHQQKYPEALTNIDVALKLKPDDKSFLEVKRILEHNAQATKKP
jgi:tetratricopeptide (TPR) repeat protein